MHHVRVPIAVSLMLAWLAGCGPPDSATAFTNITGLKLPANTSAEIVREDHGGVFGDGETNILIQGPAGSLNEWLAKNPPWGVGEWKQGPLPKEIVMNCTKFRESEWNPLESSTIWYAARQRGPKGMLWHNGDVIVIDSEVHRAWLVSWDN